MPPAFLRRLRTMQSVKLIGVEAGGRGSALGQHAASLTQRQARRVARLHVLHASG